MRRLNALVVVAAWCVCATVSAHPLAPAALMLEVKGGDLVDTSFRTTAAADARLELVLPEHCRVMEAQPVWRDGTSVVRRQSLRCSEGIEGATFFVRGLDVTGVGALVRLRFPDGRSVQALLDGGAPRFQVPRRSSWQTAFRQYLWLGVEHLWTGLDHVLFLITLLLVVPERRRAVLALSAFTLGHSLTLALAALDVLRVPEAPVEVGIAASLVWMAVLAALEGQDDARVRRQRRAIPAAAGFGLLHGLGFAGVLRDAGLSRAEVPASLFAFNLGIELGQLALAVVWWTWLAAWHRVRLRPAPKARFALLYAVGGVAAFWVLERSWLLL